MQKTRWGILSTGSIANRFAMDIRHATNAQLVAVGSRTFEAAQAFASKHAIPSAHGSYEALVADPNLDAIYVATPHNFHCENALLALNAGKHVLVEKPFCVNAPEADRMIAAARANKRFLMEAMWTRFLPPMAELRRLISAGELGDLKLVQADLGFKATFNPQGRLFNPHLAGGALLDLGIYPVSFACMLLGIPTRVRSHAMFGSTGVDEQFGAMFEYPGKLAVLTGTLLAATPAEASVIGSAGRIRVHAKFYRPSQISIWRGNDFAATREFDYPEAGFQYQIEHASACIQRGQLDSDIMPLAESRAILGVMDGMRADWGLRYPFEP
jgi:predicted dehydrogenase